MAAAVFTEDSGFGKEALRMGILTRLRGLTNGIS